MTCKTIHILLSISCALCLGLINKCLHANKLRYLRWWKWTLKTDPQISQNVSVRYSIAFFVYCMHSQQWVRTLNGGEANLSYQGESTVFLHSPSSVSHPNSSPLYWFLALLYFSEDHNHSVPTFGPVMSLWLTGREIKLLRFINNTCIPKQS